MSFSLILILLGVLATILTHFLMNDRGYVLVNFLGRNFETSVPGMLLVLLFAYVVVRVLVHLLRAPREFGEAVGRQRAERGKRRMTQGLIEMAEGNFARSERILSKSAKSSETPLLGYLNAARAAQAQGAHDRRDNWLMLAYEGDKDAGNAVLLTQAELQIDHGQLEEALATLRKLNDKSPGHGQGLALLASIYRQLEDWNSLRKLLPDLGRKGVLDAATLEDLTRRAWVESLRKAGRGDAGELEPLWQSAPKAQQKDPAVLHAYIAALSDSQQSAAAEKLLRKALQASFDRKLVLDYGRLRTDDLANQLNHAESWLKKHPNDPALLVTAARLAMGRELWGKARSYLETGIALEPTIDAYQLYGQLLEKMGENEGAASAFRLGLNLATGRGDGPRKLDAPRTTD